MFLVLFHGLYSMGKSISQESFFEQNEINLGTIDATKEQIQTVRFSYINNTGKTVCIAKVKTSCGCLSANYTHKPIEVFQKGSLEVVLDLRNIKGYFRRTLLVYLENASPVLLRITGNVSNK